MRRLAYGSLYLASMGVAACSIDAGTPGAAASAGASNVTAGSGTSNAGSSASGAGSGGALASGGSVSGSGGQVGTLPSSEPTPMPVISHGVPAFASSSGNNSQPALANDGNADKSWSSAASPAWLAYDLSGVPTAQRQQVLIAWYAPTAPDFINPSPGPDKRLPVDYTLESNTAPGGGPAPSSGWSVLATVTNNDRSTRQRLLNLNGANWVRLNVTKGSSPNGVTCDLDVHSAPDGASDSWLFMGDSITFMNTTYVFSDLPKLVNAADPKRWPAVVPAGIGGTNTTTALAAIQQTMADFPGRFVTLNYGTNDHPNEYHMEELVQAVIAAGKVPVVPHMPWSDTSTIQESAPKINAAIDALYLKYPAILKGPDFWSILVGRTDVIPSGDIHPGGSGQEVMRKEWAKVMSK